MIYVMLIGVICVAEFVIRRHINKNFTASERKSIGKGHITLRKYHNAGMANDTLEKRPALVKGIGVSVVSLIAVTFVLAMMLKGKKALKAGLALILGGGLAFFSWLCDRLYPVSDPDSVPAQVYLQHCGSVYFYRNGSAVFPGIIAYGLKKRPVVSRPALL